MTLGARGELVCSEKRDLSHPVKQAAPGHLAALASDIPPGGHDPESLERQSQEGAVASPQLFIIPSLLPPRLFLTRH